MKSIFKYNDEIFETEALLFEAHENANPVGHEPIMETKTFKETIPDPKEPKKTITKTVKKDVKVGNVFLFAEMTKEHAAAIQKLELTNEQKDIEKWYRDHDYYINKVLLGEWEKTDQRYIDYKAERLLKQKRLDEIKIELSELQN